MNRIKALSRVDLVEMAVNRKDGQTENRQGEVLADLMQWVLEHPPPAGQEGGLAS
jgi:hypothetical protein